MSEPAPPMRSSRKRGRGIEKDIDSTAPLPPPSQPSPPHAPTSPPSPPPDSQIDRATSLAYWGSTSADVNGMLGGYPQVSGIDLRGSRAFLAKLRRQRERLARSDREGRK